MRIFLLSQQAQRRHAVPAYAFWEDYFKAGLAEAGHIVLETPGADWAEGLLPLSVEARRGWIDRVWTQTIAALKDEHARKPVDLVLSYLFPAQVEPSAIATIRKMGIPCVNFFCDNVREFTQVPGAYHCFDLHWVPEYEACAMYHAAKLPLIHAPMPVWVPPGFRQATDREGDGTVFIGSHDALREALLAKAVARGLRLRIHGEGWRTEVATGASGGVRVHRSISQALANQCDFFRAHGFRGYAMKLTYKFHRTPDRSWLDSALRPAVYNEDYLRATREAVVTVGINRYPSFRHPFDRPHAYSRLRDIEAPMLGACYLTEAAPGLEKLYTPGEEIEVYRNADELVAKTAQLLGDPQRRMRLRTQGQRRALTEHTIGRSVERIASALGI